MQAMILAAGFGTRLLPFTHSRPKPLFPLINKPLLLLTIERLRRAGCDRIVVNCHHLRRQIVELLQEMPGVVIQQEEVVLGTGGGLRLALGLFRDEPILVTNGDIYHTVDVRALYQAHLRRGEALTLAMHDCPRFNTVSVADGRVMGFDGGRDFPLLAFTGLQVVNPELLEPIPLAEPSSIIDHYRRVLNKGTVLAIERVDGCYWTDMGTMADYLALHGGLLMRTIPWWPELGEPPESPFYLRAPGGEVPTMRDWVCAGHVTIGRDVHLERVVLWDGAVVPDGSRLQDTLIIHP